MCPKLKGVCSPAGAEVSSPVRDRGSESGGGGGWFQIFKPFHENLGHVLLILVGSQDIYEEVEGFGDLEIWNLMQNNSAR